MLAECSKAFAKRYRLTKTDEYSSVFGFRRALRGALLMLHYLPGAAEHASARLGLVVGKKFLKTSVGRNRLKRVVRERFRLRRAELPVCDIIVRLITRTRTVDRQAIADEMDHLLSRLQRQKLTVN